MIIDVMLIVALCTIAIGIGILTWVAIRIKRVDDVHRYHVEDIQRNDGKIVVYTTKDYEDGKEHKTIGLN